MSVLAGGTGCQKYLDVNHDPSVVEEIKDPKLILPTAQLNVATQVGGWDLGLGGSFWVQYWTQKHTASQFKTMCNYSEQRAGWAYGSLTSGALQDFERIKKISEGKKEYAGYAYIAEALSIYTWQVLTDVWGDLPYFEAQKGAEGIYSPKFNTGQEIYTDLLKRVEALIAQPLPAVAIDTHYDFLASGDFEQWKRFANTLKLKLMLRLSETAEYDNAKTLAFVQSGNFLKSSVTIPGSVWEDGKEGKRHPLREYEQGGANNFTANIIACTSFIEYLKAGKDPRLETLFTSVGGAYRGGYFGDYDSVEKTDGALSDKDVKYSAPIIKADLDAMLLSLWEANFYLAEVYARAGNDAMARSYYEEGVKASLKQHSIADMAILEAGGYAEWKGGSAEEMIKQIAMQKWVANANYQPLESFFERNRLKYPRVNEVDVRLNRKKLFEEFPVGDLTISVSGRETLNQSLPKSWLYPNSIVERNTNAPAQKPNVGVKIWWDQKSGK